MVLTVAVLLRTYVVVRGMASRAETASNARIFIGLSFVEMAFVRTVGLTKAAGDDLNAVQHKSVLCRLRHRNATIAASSSIVIVMDLTSFGPAANWSSMHVCATSQPSFG